MTTTSEDRFDRIDRQLERLTDEIAQSKLQTNERLDRLTTDVDQLKTDVERYNEKFDNYQQSIQWVVQLAFSLIAGATVTVIVSAVVTLLVRK